MKATDSLIIGFDSSNGEDSTVLVVGRKAPGKDVEIINAFQGEEAEWMYKRLTEREEKYKA